MGQEQDRGDRRNDFPELAQWVDSVRREFGAEDGGRLTTPDGTERRWGEPPLQGEAWNADFWLLMGRM